MALTAKKAGTILTEGMIRGRPLTKAQIGFFGAIRGGAKIRKKSLLTRS